MAGSYLHCEDENGRFTFDFIDNMGDAYEACEMMFHMIHTLAERLGDPNEIIADAEQKYYNRAKEP